jgi:hypothetical protein
MQQVPEIAESNRKYTLMQHCLKFIRFKQGSYRYVDQCWKWNITKAIFSKRPEIEKDDRARMSACRDTYKYCKVPYVK